MQPLVSKRLFKAVQNERAARSRLPTTEEVVSDLQRVISEHGVISYDILNRHGRWSSGLYTRRLGKIDEMRALLGAAPTPLQIRRRINIGRANDGRYASGNIYADDELIELLRPVLANRGMLNNHIIEETPGIPSTTTYRSRFGSMAEVYRLLEYRPSRRQVACIKASRYCHEARRKAGWGGRFGVVPPSLRAGCEGVMATTQQPGCTLTEGVRPDTCSRGLILTVRAAVDVAATPVSAGLHDGAGGIKAAAG